MRWRACNGACHGSERDSERLAALHEEVATSTAIPRADCALPSGRIIHRGRGSRLGCAHGTILSRLSRARERLRRRLTQRERFEFAKLLVDGNAPREVTMALPASLVNSTIQSAVHALAGRSASTAIVKPSVIALAQATLRSLFMTQITLVAALLTTTAVVTVVTVPFVRSTRVALASRSQR